MNQFPIQAPLSTKPQKEKELILESENKQYNLKIYILSDIYLEIKEKERMTNEIYLGNFSLDNLKNLSNAFSLCNNLDQAFNLIVSHCESKKITLNKNQNEMILNIKVEFLGLNIEGAKLILRKKKIETKDLTEQLVKKINTLEEKINKLEEKNNLLTEKNRNLEKKQAEFEDLKDLFKDEIKVKRNFKELKLDSKIIENKEDIKFIINKIIKEYVINNFDSGEIILIYRATRDGDNQNNFYNKVEGKRKTLCFIKTKKGIRFGCYFDIAFKRSQEERRGIDNKSFIFSIDRKKIYKSNPFDDQINNDSSDVIHLHDDPIVVVDNFLSNNNSYTNAKNCIRSFLEFVKDYELNNYEQYFTVEELEVFQIN